MDRTKWLRREGASVPPYTNSEIRRMSGAEQARAVRAGELSPVETVEAALERIEELDPDLNAFCVVAEDQAREAAAAAERAVERGESLGPLHGVPVAVKDLIPTAGIRSTFGSRMYEDHVPDRDAVVVERIREAGGIVIGKTNVPEFGYRATTENAVFGPTYNPWDPDLTPGGSSGGSGVAVATGMVPLALGSDGGGSVRIPSSCCGIYGMKASFGRVPLYPEHRDPDLPGGNGWESLEHVGPMARTVEDAALLLEVIAGPHHLDRHSLPADGTDYRGAAAGADVEDLRVAYSEDWGYAAVDPEVRELVAAGAEVFEDLGCTVEAADPGFDDPEETFAATVAADTDLSALRAAHDRGEIDEPELIEVLETDWTAEAFTDARRERQRLNRDLRVFLGEYDLLVTPTLAAPPFGVGPAGPPTIEGREADPLEWLAFTFPINLTGHPAATLPAGPTEEGRPVGLQVVGPHLDDATVLRASAAYEAASPWAERYFPAG